METCFLKKNQNSFFASLKKVLVFVEFFIVFSSFRVWATDSQAWRWCKNSGKWSNPDGSTNKVWEYYNLDSWKEDASAGDYPGKEATTTSYNDSACFLGTNSCTLDVDVATRLEALYINSDIKESIGTIPQKPSAGTVGSGSVTFNFTNTVDNNNGSVTAKNIYIGDYSVLEESSFYLELNGQGRIDAVEKLHFEKGYSYTIKISENVTFFAKKIVFEGSSENPTTINFTGNGTIKINEVDCADSKVVFNFNQSVDLKNSVFSNSKLLELNFSSGDGNLKTVSIGKSNESLVCHSVLIGKNVSFLAENEISVSKNLEVIFAENVVFEKKLTVLGVASFTDFKTVELKESNSFEKLSFKIENSINSATVKFGAGKTQTVNKKQTASFSCLGKKDCFITLTTDSASPSKDDKTSWWRLDSSVLALDFSFVQVEYSNSVQDFTNFAWNFDSVKESEPYSTENWFARKFYWIGNSSSNWNEKENWALDFAGSITSWTAPNSQDGKSQIVILKGSSNSAVPFILNMGGQASGQTSYKLKSIEVESGASLDFCGSSVKFSAEDSSKVLKNKGEILLFGNEVFLFKSGTKISAENITNEKGSTIVYYGDNSAHSWELPFGTSYENLVFETTAKGFIKDLIDWNDKILVKSLENAVSFLDLTVKSGRTFEIADKSVSEGCEVCVLRNLTVENDAKFVNGGKLVLGSPSSDALGGIDGTISDENADSIDFGNVEIKQGFAKKTFTTNFKSTVLKMDESSATGEIAFEKKLTVLLQTKGFSNVAGNFAVSFKSGAEIPCGASFCTTGEVSLAGSFNFSDKDLKIGNKTKILGNVDFSANNVEFLGEVVFKTDCKNVQTSKNQIFGGKISVEEDNSVQTSEKRIVFKSSQGDFHLKNGFESVGNGEVEFLCEDSEKGTFIGSPTQTSADVVLCADSIVF